MIGADGRQWYVMNASYPSAISTPFPGVSASTGLAGSRQYLMLLSTTITLIFCSLMFGAHLGTEKHLLYVLDTGLGHAMIAAFCGLGVLGALGGMATTFILLALRRD